MKFTSGLFFFLALFLITKVGFTQYSERISIEIVNGETCLKEERTNCSSFFEKALKLAKQSQQDTIIAKAYLDISKAYYHVSKVSEQGNQYLNAGLRFVRKNKLKVWEWAFIDLRVVNGKSSGDKKNNFDYLDTLIALSDEINDEKIRFKTLFRVSWHQYLVGDFNQGLRNAQKTLRIAQNLDDDFSNARAYGLIGTMHYGIKEYELSIKYGKLSRDKYLLAGDSANAMTQSMNIGNGYVILDQLPNALKHLNESVAYFERQNNEEMLGYVLAQVGRIQMKQNNNFLAAKTLERAYNYCEKLKIEKQKIYICILLAICHKNLGDYPTALAFSTKAYQFHKDKNSSDEYLSTMERHSEMLELNGKTEDALAVFKLYMKGYQENFNEEKMEEISRLQEELETELKNKEIELLKNEKKVIKNRNFGLILGAILLAIIAWLFIKRKSTKLKIQEIENEKINHELESKNRELTSQALHLAKKNELLISLKTDIAALKTDTPHPELSLLESKIKFDEQMDQNWEQFTTFFNDTKKDFFKSLSSKHPEVTKSDMRMAALLSMNLGSKEIANILNISGDGVKKARYRLRKKLSLQSDDNLRSYLAGF